MIEITLQILSIIGIIVAVTYAILKAIAPTYRDWSGYCVKRGHNA